MRHGDDTDEAGQGTRARKRPVPAGAAVAADADRLFEMRVSGRRDEAWRLHLADKRITLMA